MIALALLALLAQQQPAAQDTSRGRRCVVVIDTVGRDWRQLTLASGQVRWFMGGGVLGHCDGTTTTFAADSAAYYEDQSRFDMVKDVHIRDSLLLLDANIANYFTRAERFEASGNVVAVNRRTRSELRGPNLTYWRAARGVRDTTESYATGRPTVTYYPDTLPTTEPYTIVGDRIRFRGDDRVWAGGKVTIDRSDIAARADSFVLDETTGFGLLVRGEPRVDGKTGRSYSLAGRRIEFTLRDQEIERVMAFGTARGVGSDWQLTADTVHLFLTERTLQGAIAWGQGDRPHAYSSSTEIRADSLAFDTPGEVLSEVRAYRRTVSTMKDTTRAAAEVDWIAGDTTVARFREETDSTGERRTRLSTLVARGSARAFYHSYDAQQPDTPPALSYSRGIQIAVTMGKERVSRVVVSGAADGVHLEPLPPAPADTTRRPPTRPSPS